MKASLARRIIDALIAAVTWAAAVGVAVWFYDWVNRWYVVAAVVLLIVAGAMIVEKPKASKPDAEKPTNRDTTAALASLPSPREADLLDEIGVEVA